MNNLQVFENEQFGSIRTIMMGNEPWFIGKDVADVLGYRNSRDALMKHVDDEDKNTVAICDGTSGNPNMTIINESGLYALVLSSKLPTAKAFKHWVTHDVIPSIRRHGMYMTDDIYNKIVANPRNMIKLLSAYADEIDRRKIAEDNLKVAEENLVIAAPKVSYYDHVLQSPDLVKATEIAKDYGMSAVALNQKLAELGVQYKQGDSWFLYQKYADKGYTHSKTHKYKHKDGTPGTKMQTYWTQAGRKFIYDELKKAGILPTMEKATNQ